MLDRGNNVVIDWSEQMRTRKPTKKEFNLYRQWCKYLQNSKLEPEEVRHRACIYAARGKTVEFDR